MRPNAPLPVLALACLLSVVACDDGSGSTATPARVTETRTVDVRPFTAGGRPAPWVTVVADATGTCHQRSGLDSGNPRARRCFTDATSVVLDPCFLPASSARVALCLPDPTSGRATRVANTDPEASADPEAADSGVDTGSGAKRNVGPWFVELASGVRCEAATGVDVTVDGLPLTYACDDEGFLYGPVDTGGRVWTAHYQRDGASHTQVTAVRVAWR